jgi:predicted GNAT superfamily acetyltransferase
LQAGLPTDRLVAEWWLNSDRVQRTLGEATASQPVQDDSPSDRWAEQIDVPRAVYDWKQHSEQRTLAEQLQTRNREALQAAFARGLAITGYQRSPEGDGRFLLGPVTGIL